MPRACAALLVRLSSLILCTERFFLRRRPLYSALAAALRESLLSVSMHALSAAHFGAPVARRRSSRRATQPCRAAAPADYRPVPFPKDYRQMVAQTQDALLAAKADGVLLQEVQFPTGGLSSVAGDQEGNAENNVCVGYLRQIVDAYKRDGSQGRVRVLFPVRFSHALPGGVYARAPDAPSAGPHGAGPGLRRRGRLQRRRACA